MTILPVIMAGGSGSRLWPLSRLDCPKQFLALFNKDSLLQNTVSRLQGLNTLSPLIICNEQHRFFVSSQLAEKGFSHSGILLEPVGRNTAPAVTLASLYAIARHQDLILLVLSADHSIRNISAFQQAIRQGMEMVQKNKLVTFGVMPTQAHTGYGYIKKGKRFSPHAFEIAQFVEKPDEVTASAYLQSGEYLWNSGMFMFKASQFLQELDKYAPDILKQCQLALANMEQDLDFTRLNAEVFAQCRSESIDYAVMEHTQDAVVLPLDAHWSDVGSWQAIWEIGEKDLQGNVLQGDVVTLETENCLIRTDDKLVATIGVKDLVIVESKDATLVAPKHQSQQLTALLGLLKANQRQELQQHQSTYRPWGKSEKIAQGAGYQVRKVTLQPQGKIHPQRHQHRSEHWIIVQGTAMVQKGEEYVILKENQSTYIPAGVWHSIENKGKTVLEIIEVQIGECNENDIERQ